MKYLAFFIVVIALAFWVRHETPIWIFRADQPITGAADLGDGRQLAVMTAAKINILDAHTGMLVNEIPVVGLNLRAIGCKAWACWIAGGHGERGYLGILDARQRRVRRVATGEKFSAIEAIAVSADNTFATVHADGAVILWDAKTIKPKARLTTRDGAEFSSARFVPRHIRFDPHTALACDHAPDAKTLWCGLSDGSLSQIKLQPPFRTAASKLHGDAILFVTTRGDMIVTASKDKTVRAWKEHAITQ